MMLGDDPLEAEAREREEAVARAVDEWKVEHKTGWAILVVVCAAAVVVAALFGGIVLAVLIARALVSAVNWAWHL